ncbi:MAG TPA: aspartate aminotransferase family protein [Rhizomicrobium sp.]|jgi:4-aminobutyrate aminotransferase-like enzyme|nr:aspartate aminotransferase family protein [Rhizomicrobium sp.]
MAGFEFGRNPVEVPRVLTQYRRIQTPLPAPGTRELFELLDKYESRSMHGQIPIVWDRAEDFSVWDRAGNRWIDFTSTIFVANIGHSNAHVATALQSAIQKSLLHSYTYATDIRARYLQKLVEFTPAQFEKAFLLSSGTEATECAVKLMHMQGQKIGKKRNIVVSFEGAMHGRTLAAVMMGGSPASRAWVGRDYPDFSRLDYPYYWDLEKAGVSGADRFSQDLETLKSRGINPATDICGFMLESYVGWSAVFFPADYVQTLAKFARENGILLCFDEIQAGFGRTGKMFAYEHYGVEPDMICCGKGMSASLPLSGVLGRADIMDLPDVGSMSSTHSANPLACAAGLATIEEMEQRNLVAESARKGKILHNALNGLKSRYPDRISRVLGKGMVAAIVLVDPKTGAADADVCNMAAELCMRKGLIVVHTGRESIKFGPPLTIADEAILEGVSVVDEALAEALALRKAA